MVNSSRWLAEATLLVKVLQAEGEEAFYDLMKWLPS
jgi:hypothetical protein